jgi:hypothetical protein
MLVLITLSTVSLTLTSHNSPKHFRSCHFAICSMVFSCVHPTAVQWSPWESTARTSDRPICPVAPKICKEADQPMVVEESNGATNDP